MIFTDLLLGESVFVDANAFVYHFEPHVVFGPPCTDLFKRVELQELSGYTSTHVLSEVAHRLMTMEAALLFNWPSKIVQRLKQDPAKVQQLTKFRTALQKVPQMGVQILSVSASLLDSAAAISQQTGLLSNDAMIVALMQANGLGKIASEDSDFDRVPGIMRYAPV
ncbi:MAG TPA: type II toxin-antitoxin system VapC family toxin [Gemmataceae bacterium]|jgi:predicted nucleic acid-binding protein|nr:type II toxin-antitoxin system VapC family toxin [Gemmataceae bacterium]